MIQTLVGFGDSSPTYTDINKHDLKRFFKEKGFKPLHHGIDPRILLTVVVVFTLCVMLINRCS